MLESGVVAALPESGAAAAGAALPGLLPMPDLVDLFFLCHGVITLVRSMGIPLPDPPPRDENTLLMYRWAVGLTNFYCTGTGDAGLLECLEGVVGGAHGNQVDVALRRMGSIREMALAVAFLASDDAGYISGTTLHVDGGFFRK